MRAWLGSAPPMGTEAVCAEAARCNHTLERRNTFRRATNPHDSLKARTEILRISPDEYILARVRDGRDDDRALCLVEDLIRTTTDKQVVLPLRQANLDHAQIPFVERDARLDCLHNLADNLPIA